MSRTIFLDFFRKISQFPDFETSKQEWIPFLHDTKSTMQPCICGHKVKHFTYLLNRLNKTVVSIGTSCCKKYGLSEKHLENELFIHILREQISRLSYKNVGNVIIFTKEVGKLLEEYISEKCREIKHKYSREEYKTDENAYYFDIFIPLKRMKCDILELIEGYGYDFTSYYDSVSEFLKESEFVEKSNNFDYDSDNDSVSETNSEIIERLDKIEEEISLLLNEDFSEKELEEEMKEKESLGEKLEGEKLEEEKLEESLGEKFEEEKFEGEKLEESLEKKFEEKTLEEKLEEEKLEEKTLEEKFEEKTLEEKFEEKTLEESLEENLRIQKEIQKEIQQDQAEEYLHSFHVPISVIEDYERENRFLYLKEKYSNEETFQQKMEKYSGLDFRQIMQICDVKLRIQNLKTGIEMLKKDFAIFDQKLLVLNNLLTQNNEIVRKIIE